MALFVVNIVICLKHWNDEKKSEIRDEFVSMLDGKEDVTHLFVINRFTAQLDRFEVFLSLNKKFGVSDKILS